MARRLAAIMFTDLEGFTSATQEDERAALRLLEEQEELITRIVTAHRGRLVKSMGDGLLMEFPNARDALECAVSVQRSVRARNSRKRGRPLRIRAGLHLGDVEVRGTDILGDAVNIASRIEPLAEGGGICLSSQVYDQVSNKVPHRFERLGPRDLRGVRRAVEVYRVVMPWAETPSPRADLAPSRLAVLPLRNISSGSDDEYFADGLTEELIAVVSQVRGLRVIAPSSVLPYKGSPRTLPQIANDLRVSSVLEGSVRRSGERLRITLQLVDVKTQEPVWVETYDRALKDVFAVQNEIARRVAADLGVRLGANERARLGEPVSIKPESYLAYLKGRSLMGARWSPEEHRAARAEFERAIALDSGNARAHAGLSDAIAYISLSATAGDLNSGWLRTCQRHVRRAIDLDPNLAEAHCSLAALLWAGLDWAGAEAEFLRALALNPSCSQAHFWYGGMLQEEARTDEALAEFELAEECDPRSVLLRQMHALLLVLLQRWAEAKSGIEALREMDPYTHWLMVGWRCYVERDAPGMLRVAEAKDALRPGSGWPERVWAHAVSGNRKEAWSVFRRHRRPRLNLDQAGLFSHGDLAMTHAVLGDFGTCLKLLERLRRTHMLPLGVLMNDPTLANLRKDPRFVQLLKRARLPKAVVPR